MLVIGIDCRTCHRTHEISPEGAVIFKGSLQVCSICHAASTVEKLESYHKQLQDSLPEIHSGLARAAKALATAKITEDRKADLEKQIAALKRDVNFVKDGNDIHNIHYAGALVHSVLDRVTALCRELDVAGPQVTLPQPPAMQKE